MKRFRESLVVVQPLLRTDHGVLPALRKHRSRRVVPTPPGSAGTALERSPIRQRGDAVARRIRRGAAQRFGFRIPARYLGDLPRRHSDSRRPCYYRGNCIITDKDGDRATLVWLCDAKLGERCDGPMEWVGGTGKYTGIKGNNTFNGGLVGADRRDTPYGKVMAAALSARAAGSPQGRPATRRCGLKGAIRRHRVRVALLWALLSPEK